ncbi:TPA: DUF1642 domain-containing protein [Streptococcus agalactiae]|nr:DUF1642 domain-containing protein [Streptococcus agalactiae]
MNIEEAKKAIRELEAFNYCDFKGNLVRKIDVLSILEQIDKPKPVVPQFVADWYEENKQYFYLTLHRLAWELIENLDEDCFVPEKALDSDFKRWYFKNKNAIQTLINMHQFGYTVKKEKLYIVEIPNTNAKGDNKIFLCKDNTGKILICKGKFNPHKNKCLWLTEAEIRKDFDWAWQFREEVVE